MLRSHRAAPAGRIAPAAALVLLLALAACAAPRCKNAIVQRVPSPDRAQDAVVYQRDCGAADGASTEVAVTPHGADLPDLPTTLLSLADPVPVTAGWATPDSLVLTYPATTRVVARMARSPNGIAVAFRTR